VLPVRLRERIETHGLQDCTLLHSASRSDHAIKDIFHAVSMSCVPTGLHLLNPTCTRFWIEKKNMEIAVALDSSYEGIRCTTHAPVRNASGEGPSECYFKSSEVTDTRCSTTHSTCTSFSVRKILLAKSSMIAFQFTFSGSALEKVHKQKVHQLEERVALS